MTKKLTVILNDFGLEDYFGAIKTLCTEGLGYKLLDHCSCCETRYVEGFKKNKRFEEKHEKNLQEKVDCIHYGVKSSLLHRKGEGVVFVLESFKEDDKVISTFRSRNGTRIKKKSVSTNFFDPEEQVGMVRCYGYGDNYEGSDVKTDFVCPKGCWKDRVRLPSVVKSLELREDYQLSDILYDFLGSKQVLFSSNFERSNSDNISKELMEVDLMASTMLEIQRDINTNSMKAIKEIVDATNFSRENKKLRFIPKREIDVPDSEIEGEDEAKFFDTV